MNTLRYNKPAKKWREALPIGNGCTWRYGVRRKKDGNTLL